MKPATIPDQIIRGAKAICQAKGVDPESITGPSRFAWMDCIAEARAAFAAFLTNQDREPLLTVTAAEAAKLCARLEFDASWDKAGSGYYALKRQLQVASRRAGAS